MKTKTFPHAPSVRLICAAAVMLCCALAAHAADVASPKQPYRFVKEKVTESDRPRSKDKPKVEEPDILEPLYRFDFVKVMTVTQPDESGKSVQRRTEMSAVMILELKALTPEGATGTLRFDSVKLTLPEMEAFTSLDFSPQPQKEKNRLISEAMQSAIKVARWQIAVDTDGAIQLLSRTPANFSEIMKETAVKAAWRKRWIDDMARLVEQDMGLKTPTSDRQLLLCFNQPASDKGASGKLQPERSLAQLVSREGRTAHYSFDRLSPAGTGTPFPLPFYSALPAVNVTFKGVKSNACRAEFDMEKGMLDTMQEDYTATLTYDSGSNSIEQNVRVEYRLTRLAPPINKN